MFKAPKNTKISLSHGDKTIHIEFDHWDTNATELIEGFLGALVAVGFSESGVHSVIAEMAECISDSKKIDEEELHD